MAAYDRVVIKIGSNVLTRADGSLDITRMSALTDQIACIYKQGIEVIMVTSGAVASGRSEMKGSPTLKKHLDPISSRQLFSAVGQAKLINRYYELFREHGITCGQVLTTKENFSTRHQYLNQKHCMEVMLDNGVIPIVNENDTISVTELMFTDNDELSGLLAAMMDAEALILLSNVDGVFDGNPADADSHLIPDIDVSDNDSTLNADSFIQESKSSFGRGGMTSKYATACKVANEGIAVFIANGKRDDILVHITSTDRSVPYTRFAPSAHPVSSMKKWMAHSKSFAKGEIYVNQGAYDALMSTNRASSLLPVGVTKVKGEFEKDDLVKIISPDGKQFAIGRAGCDSTAANEMIGKQGERPLIHYNYLYIE